MKDCVFRLKLTEEELFAGKHDISELEFRNIYRINLKKPLNERLCIPTRVN